MPLQTITEINLDINQPGVSVVHAKQYDTVRHVKAHLFYNGVKWLVPSSNYEAVVAYKKADRIGGFYDETEDSQLAITVDANDRSIIYILLDRNVVTTTGNVNTEITFYDTVTLGRLSTFSFITQVEEATVTELDLASNPYFNVLAEDIRAVLEAKDSIAGLTATATGRAAGTSPTVSVTGGTSSSDPYVLHFGIPKGDTGATGPVTTISNREYAYALSTSGTTVPSSGWKTSTSSLGDPSTWQGKYLWSRVIVTFDNSETLTYYAVAYCGIDGSGSPGSATPLMDGTATAGSANAYARQDHVHPTDTSRQQTLVSGTNIKTVNGKTLLGNGNVAAIPTGGAAGKVLVKNSSTSYDVVWGDAGGALYFTNVTVTATTGDIVSLSNSAITANFVLANITFANQGAISGDVTWTTASGSLKLNGTCTTATTADIVLVLKNN